MEHLDYETLNTLKQVMEDDFALLIDTFVQDSTDRIATLRKVIQGSDADLIRRAAHSFKGSSSNVGALQLSALCAALEKKAFENNLDGLVADLDSIEQEFAQVLNLLRSFS
ncbi:Hpt domain-containing protein [Cellvibrio sp. OA-2007]|uniref:Hpt domain-containing protein n=1 Tax=Cellvibrio sp. OA-2007 TaxID=529823 RepID=UPI0007866F1E|nr:Hpt domain-containing protein [Cellvibrio sp. OA-2007]